MMTTKAFALDFEKHRSELKAFVLRMTASVADAEDLVQDTYIKAHEKLDSFRGDSSLKTWIFSIAANLTKDRLRAKKRWPENVTDICKAAAVSDPVFFADAMQIRTTSPQGHFEIKEHVVFCFTCIAKSLPLEQQLCIYLKEVYEFKVSEAAEILGISEAMVKYYLHEARTRLIEVFDNRCALINKNGVCHQCSELNGIFNPRQNQQEELVKLQLVRDAESGQKDHLFDLRARLVREIDPFESPAAELQLHHLDHNRKVMEKFLGNTPD